MRGLRLFFLIAGLAASAGAQQPLASNSPTESVLAPSWETQKLAQTFVLQIPAPRGQITDRNGIPLAQTRVGYNLALNFPTPLKFNDGAVLSFAHMTMEEARKLTGRKITMPDEQIVKHYRNRGILPLDIAVDLQPAEIGKVQERNLPNLSLHPIYQRHYPNGPLAGQIIGYAGRGGKTPEGPIENNDMLWPNAEGREGIEQTFNSQLTGKAGQLNISCDATGKKGPERIVIPPQPGYNVITTLDERIQRLAEETLNKTAKRGALVVLDPNNGDVLAMASAPGYNPNVFVPAITPEAFKALQDDPNVPLLPRAFRSAYPPGSVFKVTVGIAALQDHAVSARDEFNCPHAMEVGDTVFHNWKKSDAGMLNFRDALAQSCDTWFYQVGIKTGPQPIIDWATKMGFGSKTGIPVTSEAEGRVPTDDYMRKVHGRKLLDGDVANLSIGQGDLLITPLQMAQAMGAIGNGGTLYRTRLVQQVQSIDSQIVTAYEVSARNTLDIDPKNLAELKRAMVAVVSSGMGTGGAAGVDNVDLAGKTGTAQWGPKKKERNAAWFAGFAPAENPRYAFAALYESDPNQSAHGGTYAAPMIGKVMGELFKDEKKSRPKRTRREPAPPPPPADAQETD